MKKRPAVTLVGTLLAALLLANVALASGLVIVDCWVVGGGGGPVEAGSYRLDGTLGQPFAGPARGGGFTACAGFWCWTQVFYNLSLPLLLRP